LLLEFRRRGTENISPNLMQCPEPWAVAKDIIQELTFLARENCRVKSFFARFTGFLRFLNESRNGGDAT